MECFKNRHIWIMNHYAGNMFFDQGGRHYSFTKYLKRFGNEPVIFCCNAVHNGIGLFFQDDSLWNVHMAEEIQVPFVFVKGRPYDGNGIGRILNMIDFYRNVKTTAKEYAKEYGIPDIIFASSVHPLTLLAGIQLARYFHVRCICEVRDLWPETIVAYGLASQYNPVILAMRQMEKWIYKHADALVFTQEGGYDYIREQGWENDIPISKVYSINNGVDLEIFNYNKEHYLVEDEDLKKEDIFKVVYTGSIRFVNHLGILLDVAKVVDNPRVKFLIWGKGEELAMLQKRISEEDISNVVVKGYVDKKYVPYIVSHADLNIVHNGASQIWRFGASLNKLFDYMAAGKPILADFPCNYNPVTETGAGIDIQAPTVRNIAKAIDDCVDMSPKTYENYCRNARKGAVQYDFPNLTKKLTTVMMEACISEKNVAQENQ